MHALGIRASTNEIVYTILKISDDDQATVITLSSIVVPVSLNFPERLNFVRKTFKDIILEYDVKRAGIRVAESVSKNINMDRISYEAILQEVLASSSIEKYLTGQIANISAKLGIPRENFKQIIAGDRGYKIFQLGHKYSSNHKEAVLVGLAALNL